jgi:hypothetical protein
VVLVLFDYFVDNFHRLKPPALTLPDPVRAATSFGDEILDVEHDGLRGSSDAEFLG